MYLSCPDEKTRRNASFIVSVWSRPIRIASTAILANSALTPLYKCCSSILLSVKRLTQVADSIMMSERRPLW